jgi:hypothetical protein
VTLSGWAIIVGSAFVVLAAFDTVAGLRSLETREAIEAALEKPPYSELGLDVSAVRQLLHVTTMVAAGCATAATVLGYQVLRRNRAARVVLTGLVAPLFGAGLATQPFYSSIVTVAVLTLWLEPARGWFAGRADNRANAGTTG